MDNEKKVCILFTDDGYYLPTEEYTIRYGEVVCLVLNEYLDGNNMPPHFRDNELGNALSQSPSRIYSALAEIRAATKKISPRKELDPFLKTLPLIVFDRKHYAVDGAIAIYKYGMEIETYLDEGKIKERAYVNQLEDLLPHDIKKVLDKNIPIYQCYCRRYFVPNRRGQKYCHEHGVKGTNKAKYQSRKNDERKRIYYKIYNRLLASNAVASGVDMLDQFKDEYAKLFYDRENGIIDEKEMIAALQNMDDKYRTRKRRS